MRVKAPNPLDLFPGAADPRLRTVLQTMQLKRLYRQGWLKRGVAEAECESVADHSFSVALLALLAPAPEFPVDRTRAVLLALLHELGEVYAGDITPVDGVSKEEKARRELESVERVLEGHPDAAYLRSLWEEFEAGASPEARFVRQLDRLELGLQAETFKAEGKPRMDEFLESADRAVTDPALRSLLRAASGTAGVAP
jgi:putative hydrolase of HD superfamily